MFYQGYLDKKTHILEDIELQIWAKICLLPKIQRCEEWIFANFGLDFKGQYVVYYGKTCCSCQVGT
jgi:hypothetical protein